MPGPPGRAVRSGQPTLGPAPRRGSPRPARAALPAPPDAQILRIQAPPEDPPAAGHAAPAPGPPAPSSAAAGPSSVTDRLERMRSEAVARRAALNAARGDLWAQHEASQMDKLREDVDMTSIRDPKDEKE